MTFAEQLRAERKALGLTQAECAELLEVSKRTLEMWERGEGGEPFEITKEGAFARLQVEAQRQAMAKDGND